MFGISWAELLVILLVAVVVIPARYWGDVAKFLAKCIKFIRNLIWKISDASESIKEQIELEKPLDDLIRTTTDDIMSSFSTPKKSVDAPIRRIQKKAPPKEYQKTNNPKTASRRVRATYLPEGNRHSSKAVDRK